MTGVPTRSERFTVSRDFPQGTGVESINRAISPQDGGHVRVRDPRGEQTGGLADTFAQSGLLGGFGKLPIRCLWAERIHSDPTRSRADAR